MAAFDYTSGNPNNLVGGTGASMVDIQGPFTDIRTFLNARIAAIPTLVSSLPVSPVDGQEIYYQTDGTNGVIWHLRYRAASASTYKWEFVGGSPMYAEVVGAEQTSSVTYVALGTAGPTLTAPLAGDYLVTIGALITPPASNAQSGLMSYSIGGTGASDNDAVSVGTLITSNDRAPASGARERLKTIAAATTALTAQYRSSQTAVTAQFSNRWMRVVPRRVG